MLRSILVLLAVAGLGGPVFAQPAAGSGSAAPAAGGAAADRAELPVPPPVAPVMPQVPSAAEQKAACNAAIAADDAWATELAGTDQLVGIVRKIHATELVEMSRRASVKDAEDIAKNKRHVIMAYLAMWLLSVGFLIFMWRRQAHLRGQIDQLKRDLEAALKDGK
jgi:hypothetical protein